MTAAILADFKTWPYAHQLEEFEKSADSPVRALLWHMRTGKSKLIIDTACHLFGEQKIDSVLLFAPNGVHENWIEREFPAHCWPSVPILPIVWRTEIAGAGVLASAKKARARNQWWLDIRESLKDRKHLCIFAFNSESMIRGDIRRVVARIVKRRRCLIVFDESQDWGTPGSKRTWMARAIAKRCPYRRILTGTPVHNSPLRAWSQYELLEPGCLGFKDFGAFEKHHAEYKNEKNKRGQTYKKLIRYKDLKGLRLKMAKLSSIVRRNDCEDMPDLVPIDRHIALSEEQRRIYKDLHKQFRLEIEEGLEISIGERASRLNKLQQVVSGFIKDKNGKTHIIPGPNARLEALSDEVYLAPGKVIVWCRFQEDIDMATARLRRDGHKVLEYHGRTSAANKALAREMFAPGAENDAKALVGFPVAGLNFSAASEVIWYSHVIGDAVKRSQADERATAIGGRNIRVTNFVAPGVDQYAMDMLRDKLTLANELAGDGLKRILEGIDIG